MIPLQLKNMKFCRVLYKSKKPFEKDWTNKPYSYEEISKFFPKENYGIHTGVNNLGVLDDDTSDNKLIKIFEESFGEEHFRVRNHYYIILDGWDGKKIIFYDKDGKHMGELQGKGQQVVGPGSIHPSGEVYELKNDCEVKHIDYNNFINVFNDFIPKKEIDLREVEIKTNLNWEGDDVKDIPITSIISLSGLRDMGNNCYQGSHPFHGSTGGMNFRVDLNNNTWFCFRCSSGGSSPELLAVKEGIINCSESGRGCFAGDKGSQVIKIAREKYGLKTPESKVTVINQEPMGWACSVNIKTLAERYDFINCLKCDKPFEFNEKLGFFKCRSCGDFGGLKIFTERIIEYHQKKFKEESNGPQTKKP